jgi:hypothetical protein
MTTLATEIEVTDAELHDLLAHRWTVALSGRRVDETAELLITPPPSTSTVRWYFDNKAVVSGCVVRCDSEIRRWFDMDPVLHFGPDDQLELTLTLTQGGST